MYVVCIMSNLYEPTIAHAWHRRKRAHALKPFSLRSFDGNDDDDDEHHQLDWIWQRWSYTFTLHHNDNQNNAIALRFRCVNIVCGEHHKLHAACPRNRNKLVFIFFVSNIRLYIGGGVSFIWAEMCVLYELWSFFPCIV